MTVTAETIKLTKAQAETLTNALKNERGRLPGWGVNVRTSAILKGYGLIEESPEYVGEVLDQLKAAIAEDVRNAKAILNSETIDGSGDWRKAAEFLRDAVNTDWSINRKIWTITDKGRALVGKVGA